ncbi:MAG: arylsulfatase [Candidatus Marithrix sp.]
MNFKKTIATICATSAITFISPLQQAIAETIPNTGNKPNFVTIIIDDMGFSDMGMFGGEVATPNLESLSNDGGITLTNFYAAATSTPSRALLFTGKDNHQVGIGNMAGFMRDEQRGQPGYEGVLPTDTLIFPEVLQDNGYHTMMVGKWDMGEEPGLQAHDRGFTETYVLLPGGDVHFISDENGQLLTSQPPSFYENLGRTSPYNQNGKEITEFPANSYSATLYTDKAIEMLDKRADAEQPFYLNVSHISTHFPLQAPEDMIAKYLDTYAQGWDVLRANRFTKLKELNIVAKDAEIPPRWKGVKAWDDLTAEEQKSEAKSMAVYAAMTEILDDEIGRLVIHLKDIGEYENTVFLVASDNGGAFTITGNPAAQAYRAEAFTNNSDYENMGNSGSYIGFGLGWSQVSNTPFNNHKGATFEGGIHTAGFISYPQSKVSGVKYDCMHSIMDFAPTILDMAEITYPTTFNGEANAPMQGVSMGGIFDGYLYCDANRAIGWELDGVKGLRQGVWKLSQQRNDDSFYMFNLANDPFELNDLSESKPEKFGEMLGLYQQYVEENGVIEVSNKKLKLLGNATKDGAVFTGGVSTGRPVFSKKANVKTTDKSEISSQIRPKPIHLGKMVEISVVASYLKNGDAEPSYLGLNSQGEIVGIADKDSPPVYTTIPMQSALFIPIYNNNVAEGTYNIDICYKLVDDGTKVCTEEAIELVSVAE